MKKIVIATQNKGKLQEYETMLEPLGFEVFSLYDFDLPDIPETRDNFLDNAKLKAEALTKVTSEMIIADDSGLEVYALNMAPGVHSKRFSESGSDADNNKKLLEMMSDKQDRSARFVTVIILIDKQKQMHWFKGELHGYIHTKEEGEGGFGYDPIFIPIGHTHTLAELGETTKNKISHRARCLKRVIEYLEQYID